MPDLVEELIELLLGDWITLWRRFFGQQPNQERHDFCIEGGAE